MTPDPFSFFHNTTDGTVAQRIDFDEFGQVLIDTNPGFQPFGFAGGLYDTHTGLVRFGARDYDALTGRWTAKDAIRFNGGTTGLYSYAFEDPVNFADPNGNWVWVAGGAAIGAAINVTATVIANGGDVSSQQLAAAAVSGAISGAYGALAGPFGGTVAKALGQTATSALALGINGLFSAAGGFVAQTVANAIDPCNAQNPLNAALFAGIGGSLASSLFPTPGMLTLNQAQYFAPSTFNGINQSAFVTAAGASSGVGAAANFFNGPF